MKKVLALVMVLALALSFTACGGSAKKVKTGIAIVSSLSGTNASADETGLAQVDSTVAAYLMKQAGCRCMGATMRLYQNEDLGQSGFHTCCSAKDVEDAAEVAFQLDIPFEVVNYTEEFREKVIAKFIETYEAGGTPNPCIDCNKYMKFRHLLDWARAHGMEYVVTGHYARVEQDEATGRFLLKKGLDEGKDQSYVLYQLTQEQLSHLLLPVGSFEKPEIREQAEEAGLANAHQADSQDICFIPDGDYVRFLRDYGGVTPQPGDFVDETGRVLGRHRGLECYTAGQRKGLGVSADRPLYVISKNAENNTVLLGDNEELFSAALLASRVNWIAGETPVEKVYCTAKTRYSQKECDAVVTPLEGGCAHVELLTPQRAVTAGQAVVFYDGEEVLGGGTIEKAL